MTPPKVLFWLCLSFIVGIFLQSAIKIPQVTSWGILFLGVFIIVISFSFRNNFFVTGFCILFLVLGIAKLQISEFNILNDTLSKFNDKPEKVSLAGRIISEPDVRDTSQKLKVEIEELKTEGGGKKYAIAYFLPPPKGSAILVTTQRYPEYKYLDTIKVTGKLKTPPELQDFNYKDYLMKDRIYSVMDFPNIEVVSQKHQHNIVTFLYEKVLFLKGRLVESVNINFSTPNDSILEGIIFGNDKNMPRDLKNNFNMTGLSHLTAVSGSNIVIVTQIVMVFLLAMGFWRGQACYFAIIFIWFYITLIGFPVSGIRAAIMGSTGLLAGITGRQNTSSRVIVLTATIMLLQNPLLLFYDISFQLSFLASLGIIHVKPLIDAVVKIVAKDKLKFWADILSITFAAQILTLPVIMYNFGTISLVSPITNILVLPIIPLLTILGFLAAIFGALSNILGFIFSLPCLFLLMYFLKVVDIFSKPWAVKVIENISWIWLVAYYVSLSILIWFLRRKQKPKFLGY